MTKITNELLEDYAMLYPRIECVKMRFRNKLMTPIEAINHKTHNFGVNIEYIQLRSIESITDEEAVTFQYSSASLLIKHIKEGIMMYGLQDELRSLGIATNYLSITVDELVESGKLKLI